MFEQARDHALDALDPLVGEWITESTHPLLPGVVVGRATFEWLTRKHSTLRLAFDERPVSFALGFAPFYRKERTRGVLYAPRMKALKARARAILNEVLSNRVRDLQLVTSGRCYVRRAGSVAHLLEIQYSRWSDSGELRFTLNCGIYVPGVTSTFRNKPEPAHPTLSDCCMIARAGLLTCAHLDVWWKINFDEPEGDRLIETGVAECIRDAVLPFWSTFRTSRAVAEFLCKSPTEQFQYVEPRAEALRLAYSALVWRTLDAPKKCRQYLELAVARSAKTPFRDPVLALRERGVCD